MNSREIAARPKEEELELLVFFTPSALEPVPRFSEGSDLLAQA